MLFEIPPILSIAIVRALRQANRQHANRRHFMVNRRRFLAIAMTATYFERVRTFESRAAFEDFMEDYGLVCMEEVLSMNPRLCREIAALLAIIDTYGQQV